MKQIKENKNMKKLMVIAALMAAVAANAATFSWQTSAVGKIYEAGSTTALIASGTAYLFDSGKVAQDDVLAAFVAGTALDTLGYASSGAVSAGAISKVTFDVPTGYATGDAFNGYFALVVDDSIYIAPTVTAETPATGNKAMSFNAKTSSQLAAMDSAGGYSAAGWYTAVPEPTSGLLLILGMAGLALKRKRA